MKLAIEGPTLKKFFIKLTLILVIIGNIVYLIILPSLKNITDNYSKFIAERIKYEKNIEKNKKFNILSKKYSEIEPLAYKIDNLFINKNRELELITKLETFSEKYNINQTLNLQSQPEDAPPFSAGNINLTLEGTYANLYKYLYDLEKLDFYMNINNLSLSISPGRANKNIENQNEESNLNMSINAQIYWN